jgi:hypothetical protein
MAVAIGYMFSQSGGYNTQQIYRVALKVLDSTKVKFGGFNYSPVIFKIPSGYARTGAYITQYASDGSVDSYKFYIGVCNFDTLGDRVQISSSFTLSGSVFVAVYDTGEFVLTMSDKAVFSVELLDPSSLNPIGFMISHWYMPNNTTYTIYLTQDSVTQGSVGIILPEPIRVGDTVKASKMYFATPLGLAVSRWLYSCTTPNTLYGIGFQIGSRKFINASLCAVDITDEVV